MVGGGGRSKFEIHFWTNGRNEEMPAGVVCYPGVVLAHLETLLVTL